MAEGNKHSLLETGNMLMVQERERYLGSLLRRLGYESLESTRIFEAGCAGGYNLRMFVQWGARPQNVAGMDLDEDSVNYCLSRASDIRVHAGSAENIPEDSSAFDITLAFTLFSSVPDDKAAQRIANEMLRLTRPGGLILLYDMRRPSPKNPNVHRIKQSNVRRWFEGHRMRSRSITLAPPLARAVGRWAPWLYGPLAALPFLRTHNFYVIRRGNDM